MNRRGFIKRGALWVPTIVGLKAYPQALTLADPAKVLGGATVAACDTIKEQQTTYDAFQTFGEEAAYSWIATKFTPSSSFSGCSVQVYMRGYPSASTITFRAGVFADSSGSPGTQSGGWSSTYTASVGTSFVWVDLGSFSSDPSLTSGTAYFLVLNSVTTSTTNYCLWGRSNSGNSSRGVLSDSDGAGTWGEQSAAGQCDFKLYGR